MKIHFASFIGVDFDLDLSRYWIPYYLARKFDSYTVFLHRAKGQVPAAALALYKDAGFRVLCVDGPFCDGMAKSVHLRNFARNLPANDFIVTADGDEFQAMPDGSPINYRQYLMTYDIIHGIFEERYGDRLDKCEQDPFIQYPHIEPYTGEYFKTFVPPFLDLKGFRALARTKIIACRAKEDVMYSGCHLLSVVPHTAKIFFNCKVIHFAWREAAARKFAVKSYFTIENIRDAFLGIVPEGMEESLAFAKTLITPDEEFLNSLTQKGVTDYALQN